jgi:hypothetical protein
MPQMTQSYNRYSYCMNNPTSFTDPTGNDIWGWLTGGLSNMVPSLDHALNRFGNWIQHNWKTVVVVAAVIGESTGVKSQQSVRPRSGRQRG